MATAAPLALADAASDTRWVTARPLVLFFVTTPDPTRQVAYRVHVVAQALDGGDHRIVTPHNAGWAQLSPDATQLASISFPERQLIVTDLASNASRVVVADVAPDRAKTLVTDLPPTLQWSPDGSAILVQSPEDDRDGDGQLDRATMRLWDVASGALVRDFHRPEMGPYLFVRDGDRIAVPSLARERAAVVIELDTLAESEHALVGPGHDGGLTADALHVNQTPSLVLHDTAIAADDATITARGRELVLTGRGAPRTVVVGKTSLYAPSWDADGRHAVFAADGQLYVYDATDHRLGRLGPGAPSPLVIQPGYRPPPRRLQPPGSPFDLAFRTY